MDEFCRRAKNDDAFAQEASLVLTSVTFYTVSNGGAVRVRTYENAQVEPPRICDIFCCSTATPVLHLHTVRVVSHGRRPVGENPANANVECEYVERFVYPAILV